MAVKTICVCGAGTMGSGIAQVAAQAGFKTILYDLQDEILQKARKGIEESLQYLLTKEKISAGQKQEIYSRISFTSDIRSCRAEVFIEAIIEKPGPKIDLFNQLATFNPPGSIFASNTSSLSVNSIAAGISHPERVIGLHFFNPAPVMKLVEIVHTSFTNERTLQVARELAERMGKISVQCSDSPGFIVNRVARPFYIESLRLAEEGLAEYRQIDDLLESSGFRMGPFRLMDLIGNDINYAVSCSVYEQLERPERLRPSPLQKKKVESSELGRKTGRGYYDYTSHDDRPKS